MVIASFGPRIRLLGAALSLACAGPAIAQPIDAECDMLWHLAEMAPYLDQLMENVGGTQEVEALLAFDRALRRATPRLVANAAVSGGHLADRVPQLVAHVEALQALRREAAQGNHANVRAGAYSPELRAGAALVQRLLVDQGCRGGWFVGGEGAGTVHMPRAAIGGRAIEPAEHVEISGLGAGNLAAFALAALTAGALAAFLWARALLRRRFKLSRRHPRYGCGCWTMVEHGGKAHKSLIIDASRLGCRITKPPRFRRGSCVTVEVCGEPVSAKVMWRREHFAGLRFAAALDEAQLAALHQSRDLFVPASAAGEGDWNTASRSGGAGSDAA